MDVVRKKHGAYLPHWTATDHSYAVTFRLGDSVPSSQLRKWRWELDILLRKNKRAPATLSTFETARLEHLLAERVQSYLDGGSGACWFNRKEAATIMFESLQHFHEQRYRILAWCIMPNHVHVVLIPLHGFELAHIVRTWKSFSARRIGQILPVKKPFWQVEYYDHLIRDSEEYLHAIHYVLNNPEKAGLTEWPWVGEGLIAREL